VGVAPFSDVALEREAAIVRDGRLRALWLWGSLAAGIALGPVLIDWYRVQSAAGFAVAAAFLLVGLLTRGWTCRVAITLAMACLGLSMYTMRAVEVSATSIARQISERAANSPIEATIMTLRARVVETPRVVQPKHTPLGSMGFVQPVTRFSVDCLSLMDDPLRTASGRLWVRIDDGSVPAVAAGDEIVITGLARPIAPPSNPGEFDLQRWGTAHGVAGTLTLSNATLISVQSPDLGGAAQVQRAIRRWHARLRDRALDALAAATSSTPEPARSMVQSLILGESPRDDTLSSSFLRLGLAHVLAISGFHLIVMSRLALGVIRLTGDRGMLEPLGVAALVIGYMLIVPADAPVLRSGLLCLTLLAADALGRRFDRAVLLILISTILLLVNPLNLWSLGYQLSCGLTLLLVWCAGPTVDNLFGIRLRGTAPQRQTLLEWVGQQCRVGLASLVGSTLLCWLASLPLIMLRTGLVSPLTLVATVIVVPPITLLLWLAFLALGIGVVIPGGAQVSAPVLAVAAKAIAWMVTTLDQLPFASVRCTRPDILWTVAATTLVITWLVRGRLRHARYWAVLGLLIIWSGVRWASVHVLAYRDTPVKVDMLDVGDGTCMLIRAERTAVLWDAGSLRPGLGGDTIVRALTELNVPRLDAILISHPDVDHFGGVPQLLRTFSVDRIITSPRTLAQAEREPKGTAAALVKLIRQTAPKTEIQGAVAGDVLRFGPLVWDVLSPPGRAPEWTNDNDHSLIVVVRTPTAPAVLLTGDAGPAALSSVISTPQWEAISLPRVVELPHHGSFNQQAEDLLRQVDPALVLQSTGPRRVSNPAWDAARKTAEGTRPWLITARDGALWVDFRRDGSWTSGSVHGKEIR
jgi:competence protein ComEC